jgi:hypothetical protein
LPILPAGQQVLVQLVGGGCERIRRGAGAPRDEARRVLLGQRTGGEREKEPGVFERGGAVQYVIPVAPQLGSAWLRLNPKP